jgi:exodeoxyribonuclease-3
MQYLDNKQEKNLIIVGDYNICHREIDIARPKENANSIGFLPIEREKVSEFLSHGFIDVFRHLYPDATDQYTWWSYRAGAKPRNV